MSVEAAQEFPLLVPPKNYVIFRLVAQNSSKRYNWIQLWLGTNLFTWVPLQPAYPWLDRILPNPASAQYTLKGLSQIPRTNTVTPSDIVGVAVSPGEWLLKIKGDENVEIQVSISVNTNGQDELAVKGDKRVGSLLDWPPN